MTYDPPEEQEATISGRQFLIGGIVVLLLLATATLFWTLTSDVTPADREWWGTPTPTPSHGWLPF
jgi:hypothetical protein